MTSDAQPASRLRLGDEAVAAVDTATRTERRQFFLDQDIPQAALDFYATAVPLVNKATDARARLDEGVSDLVFVLTQFRSAAYAEGLEDVSVFDYVAHMLAAVTAGVIPEAQAVKDTILGWDKRRIGWLAEAAGFTADEYTTAAPDLDALATLASLRHGPVFTILAGDLR